MEVVDCKVKVVLCRIDDTVGLLSHRFQLILCVRAVRNTCEAIHLSRMNIIQSVKILTWESVRELIVAV